MWFVERTGFFDAVVRFGDRDGAGERLAIPTDAQAEVRGDWLAVQPRTAWGAYGPDVVVGFSLAALQAGERTGVVLFEPGDRTSLQSFFWAGERLVLSILDELRPVFRVFTPGADCWAESALTGLPALGTVGAWPLDSKAEESDGSLLVSAQDPVTPPTLLLVEPGLGMPEVLRRAPATFDASGLVVSRHEAVSADGERIPYVQTGPAGAETGDAPVHLSGYGGFQISMLPSYRTSIGMLWLERGGTSVVANIRGGGEFGTRWHEAGRREGKARSHDDFAAVAADLVRRGVTRPGRIAAEGGSNGGLLIANMLTRYPERFGALFCTIPLIDMRRYTRLLAGASWVAGVRRSGRGGGLGVRAGVLGLPPGGAGAAPIRRSCWRRRGGTTGCIRDMRARWRPSCRRWATRPGSTSRRRVGMATERTAGKVAAFSALGMGFLRDAIGWG